MTLRSAWVREAARVKQQLAKDARLIPSRDLRDPERQKPPTPDPKPRPASKPLTSLCIYMALPRELTFDMIVRAVRWIAWAMLIIGVLGELVRGQL